MIKAMLFVWMTSFTGGGVSTIQVGFTEQQGAMAKCRKTEASYHSGAKETTSHGNKTTSVFKGKSIQGNVEVTTFCVEF